MAVYTQTQRLLQIDTTLGPDALLIASVDGEEAISQPFRFELELASPQMDVDGVELLRTPAAISFPLHDGSPRTIHGLFSRFAQTGKHEDLATYRAELVAWPWFLSLRRNNRIFQQKSILDIADEIFRFWGFTDFDIRCEDRPVRDYIVQYNESDLDFISRWLETEGIFYYFEHSPDGHVLVLADSNSTVRPCPDVAEAWLLDQKVHEMDVVTSLTREHAVHVGRVTLRDYDYLQPSLSLEASLDGDGLGEIYDYPGEFTNPDDGERYARYRLEAEEARKEQILGEGNCRWMVSGHSFELLGHFNPSTNGEYVIVRVKHKLRAGGFRSGDPDEFEYRNEFHCIPSSVPYRPPRITPRPVINGSQTAVVVGPGGEEVWTDKHGRVKVQFHWDREGNNDQDSSCWVRVTTPWGGKGYGSISIPRIGNEVLVDFLEGDPDQPVIVGSVYNAEQVPPFAPGIQMGMNSRSSPGGGGRNEISLTDSQGSEMITIHGQHDMSTTVQNDQTNTINNNRTTDVAVDDSTSVGANCTLQVGANCDLDVGGDQSEHVGGSCSESVDGSKSENVGGSAAETVAIAKALSIGAAYQVSVGAAMNESIGGAKLEEIGAAKVVAVGAVSSETVAGGKSITAAKVGVKAGSNVDVQAGAKMNLSAGSTMQVDGAKVVVNAKSELVLKCGGASVTLKGGKVTVKGSEILVKGSGVVKIRGSQIKEN